LATHGTGIQISLRAEKFSRTPLATRQKYQLNIFTDLECVICLGRKRSESL